MYDKAGGFVGSRTLVSRAGFAVGGTKVARLFPDIALLLLLLATSLVSASLSVCGSEATPKLLRFRSRAFDTHVNEGIAFMVAEFERHSRRSVKVPGRAQRKSSSALQSRGR